MFKTIQILNYQVQYYTQIECVTSFGVYIYTHINTQIEFGLPIQSPYLIYP